VRPVEYYGDTINIDCKWTVKCWMWSVLEFWRRDADHPLKTTLQTTSAVLVQLTGCATESNKYLRPETVITAVAGEGIGQVSGLDSFRNARSVSW